MNLNTVGDWICAIKNNDITSLHLICTPKHKKIDKYKELLQALKTNTSIDTLYITFNYTKLSELSKEYDKWTSILSDVLKVNNSLITIILYIENITNKSLKFLYEGLMMNKSLSNITISNYNDTTIDDYNLIINVLKTNIYISYVQLNNKNIDSTSWSNIIEFLKANKTLKTFGIHAKNNNFNGSVQLSELLLINKTLTNINLNTGKMINYVEIIDGLKHNPSITYFQINTLGITNIITFKLLKYCKRNVYNTKLKTMMLQDL
jgi:hypothetical protein